MPNVKLNASAIGGQIQTNFSGVVSVGADGLVTVDSRDVSELLRAGALYVSTPNRWYETGKGPRAGTAGRAVASTALANGSATIANQPDYPRLFSFRVDPGTSGITAGSAVLSYIANDGNVQADTVSLIGGGTTVQSTNTSKGVAHFNSVVVSGLVGGASPLMQVDDLNILALPVDPGFQDFAVTKLNVDGADAGFVPLTAAMIAAGVVQPSTAPNATHTYGAQYNFVSGVA